jgi:hypothetical protein
MLMPSDTTHKAAMKVIDYESFAARLKRLLKKAPRRGERN